jgi:hypothetical protein
LRLAGKTQQYVEFDGWRPGVGAHHGVDRGHRRNRLTVHGVDGVFDLRARKFVPERLHVH